jgi:hypothetical protein
MTSAKPKFFESEMKLIGDYKHLTPRKNRKRFNMGLGAYRVAEALAFLGPSTSIDIAHFCGASRSAVRKMIGRLRYGDPPIGPVRVCGFEKAIAHGPPVPVFAFGVEPDKVFMKQSGRQAAAKYRARNPARVDIQKRIARGFKPSPFDGLGT